MNDPFKTDRRLLQVGFIVWLALAVFTGWLLVACQPPPVDPVDPCVADIDGICVRNHIEGYAPHLEAMAWGVAQVATLVDAPDWGALRVEVWIEAGAPKVADADWHPDDNEYRLIRMLGVPGDDQCHNLTHPLGRELLRVYAYWRGDHDLPASYPGFGTDEKELADRSKWCAPAFEGCRLVDWGPPQGDCPEGP